MATPTFDPTGLNLPNFYIIGVSKSGTTALHAMLNSHPDIGMPAEEVHWFDRDNRWGKGLIPYAKKFDRYADAGKTVGERTSNYINDARNLFRLYRTTPAAKLIIMLRGPGDRWFSEHWKWSDKMTKVERTYEKFYDLNQEVLGLGVYRSLLENVYALFPDSQVYIDFTERMRGDVVNRVGLIFDFLGVDKLKAWDIHKWESKWTESTIWRNVLNGIFKADLPALKTYIVGKGFNADPIDDWCPYPPTPPVAVDDAYAATMDTLLQVNAASGVLANDTDVNVDTLTAVLANNVTNGSLTLNADGSFDYNPNTSYTGTDTFTYYANDGTWNSYPATVTITIT